MDAADHDRGHGPDPDRRRRDLAAKYLSASTDLHCVLDRRLRFRWAEGAWEEIVRITPEGLVGMPLATIVHPSDVTSLSLALRAADGSPHEFLARARRGGGEYPWLGWNARPSADGQSLVATARDVTARVEEQYAVFEELAEARRSATHDTLTGLANSVLLREHLVLMFARAQRTGVPPLVIFIDLDNFKQVNDRFGHHAGDDALRIVAQRLSESFRPSDLIARVGGDEFVIALENVEPELARRRIGVAVSRPIELGDEVIELRGSTGIALISDPTVTPDEAIRVADRNMYADKGAGAGDRPRPRDS